MEKYPLPFLLSVLLVPLLLLRVWYARNEGWGFPAGIVIITVAFWYLGDVIYNDGVGYIQKFGEDLVAKAWWQVICFLVSFVLMAPYVNRKINKKLAFRGSQLVGLIESDGLKRREVQLEINRLTGFLGFVWIVVIVVALFRVDGDFVGLFAPFYGTHSNPWWRGRLGDSSGAIVALFMNLHIMTVAGFGVIIALSRNFTVVMVSTFVWVVSLPFFLFDRTRNVMLSVLIPGVVSWVVFRVKRGMFLKFLILGVVYLFIDNWFKFIIVYRSTGLIAEVAAAKQGIEVPRFAKHEGLNMFEELVWRNYFIDQNILPPNLGYRYFSELVNPIPRALWPTKPMIGIDYAKARDQGLTFETSDDAGVSATISTGMIGQGVDNFGQLLGPMFSAFLMSIWVAVLSRQDLMWKPSRIILYFVGCVLTFNMGRDITLLVVYPFVFTLLLLKLAESLHPLLIDRVTSELKGSR